MKIPTARWNDLWRDMHAKGFMVAGAVRVDVLTSLHEAVGKAIEKGTTLAEFQKDFDTIVKKTGWTYNGERGWRTRIIYDTNLMQAYNAGKYKQQMDPAVLKLMPYRQYKHNDSQHPRPQHQAWDGLVLPADDPWWDTHMPQNGWNCHCNTFMLSGDDLREMGKEGPDQAPPMQPYTWTDKKTGVEYVVADKGIDPGFDYNPGAAAWGKAQALRNMDDSGPWRDINPWGPDKYGRPEQIPIDTTRTNEGENALTKSVLGKSLSLAIGGDVAFFTDAAGDVVEVNQAIVEHILKNPQSRWDGREKYFSFIPELIEDPYEIWISFARSELSGRIGIRRKYVKAVKLDKDRVLGLWAEFMDGHWASGDFFRGGMSAIKNLRKGRMVYGRK